MIYVFICILSREVRLHHKCTLKTHVNVKCELMYSELSSRMLMPGVSRATDCVNVVERNMVTISHERGRNRQENLINLLQQGTNSQ